MLTSLIMQSITGKPLGEVFETVDGFGFEHIASGTIVEGFDTFTEARDEFMACHNTWFDSL